MRKRRAISESLRRKMGAFCSSAEILLALDFDGTLAPLVDNPHHAKMVRGAREVLEALTELPGVSIALISGRSIASLRHVADPLPEWCLVGSHGIEIVLPGQLGGHEIPSSVPESLTAKFQAVVDQHPGTRLEQKPFGLALHTRGVVDPTAREAETAAHEVCDAWGGDLVVRTGHGIVECSIQDATKGDGIAEVRRRLNPSAVLFAGDDRTDEDGFAVLGALDVGIRVGGGETIAAYRLADASAVAEALWFIHDQRVAVESDPEL